MSYVYSKYWESSKKVYGEGKNYGQCATFVQWVTKAPIADDWRAGKLVKGNSIPFGTAIATFDKTGRYPNHKHGNHAGLYIGQDKSHIWVWNQWFDHQTGRPVGVRVSKVAFKNENGWWYHVIEPRVAWNFDYQGLLITR